MKWISSQHSAENMFYSLEGEEGTLLKMRYKPGQHTARIEAEAEKRVFIIEQQGFFRNRVVFRNEYGVKIGWLDSGNLFGKEGEIVIDGERFRYGIRNSTLTELLIYRDSKEEPVLSCQLIPSPVDGGVSIEWINNQAMLKHHGYCLLLSVCWYLFQPVAKEKTSAVTG